MCVVTQIGKSKGESEGLGGRGQLVPGVGWDLALCEGIYRKPITGSHSLKGFGDLEECRTEEKVEQTILKEF